jgi:hypothetical protein
MIRYRRSQQYDDGFTDKPRITWIGRTSQRTVDLKGFKTCPTLLNSPVASENISVGSAKRFGGNLISYGVMVWLTALLLIGSLGLLYLHYWRK